MAPSCTFEVEEDDVGEAHWNVAYKSENLISQVSASLVLQDSFIAFSAQLSISTESNSDPDEHCDKSKRHVDRKNVVKRHEIDIDESSCKENSLSQPLYHVENGN